MTHTAVDTAVIERAVELACRAPSLHNSQPWRWVASSTIVDLFADRHRIVTSADSSGREAIISCGAMLDHFRVAMASVAWQTNVDTFPNPNNLDHLASIDFAPIADVAQARRDRADAIPQRRTDRRPFRAPREWASFEPVLRSSLDDDSVAIEVLADDARPQLAEASRLTEALRRYDDSYHHELSWWTAPFRESEGIPQSALAAGAARGVDVNRSFPATSHGEPDSAARQDQAKILVLSTPRGTRADAFNCGQALSAVLLECTLAGLATCPVTHVTEIEASRDIIRELTGDREAVPQVLVRVGIAPPGETPAPTPRRPLSEVLEFRR